MPVGRGPLGPRPKNCLGRLRREPQSKLRLPPNPVPTCGAPGAPPPFSPAYLEVLHSRTEVAHATPQALLGLVAVPSTELVGAAVPPSRRLGIRDAVGLPGPVTRVILVAGLHLLSPPFLNSL